MYRLRRLRRPLLAVAWFLAAIGLSFGGAGVVARADNFAGDATRPELTWRYDRAMAPGIAAATGETRAMAAATDRLAEVARSALVDLLAGRTDAVAGDLASGAGFLAEIERRADTIDGTVMELPDVGRPWLYGYGTRTRVDALRRVVTAVAPLRARWTQLRQATVPAVQVAIALQAHDATVFAATRAGVREDYRSALSTLGQATDQLDALAVLRDQLASAVDVSTLSQWIDRSRVHDEALAALYRALRKGDADEIAAAIAKQKEAEQLLPPDTRALVVVLGDIALGGVTQAAVAIDSVRGTIADSLAALD